jgi:hypothetical protein
VFSVNAPVKIVVMIAGLFITIYIVQAVLNTISTAVPAATTFNATGITDSWTNNVSLLLVVPIALVGWYLLRIISGGED